MSGISCRNKLSPYTRVCFFSDTLLLLLLILCISGLFSCSTPPPEPEQPPPIVILEEPLVLAEIKPLPREVVVQTVAAVIYEPIYNIFRIIETTEENGVQKYFLVRMGADKTNITVGAAGDISASEAFTEIIGTYKIIEIYGDFFRCQITNLTHRIGTTAFIRLQVGEQVKQE